MADWIDVNERLPEVDGMWVLVMSPHHKDGPERWVAQWSAEYQNFPVPNYLLGGWFERDEVSHWMPIPPIKPLAEGGER